MIARWIRYLWAGPNTLLGLALGGIALLRGGRGRVCDGVVEICGRGVRTLFDWSTLPGCEVRALTLGHVVLARDAACLAYCRSHEHVHVRQYERWGPFFLPVYVASSGWALVRGRHPYHDNRFEREAFQEET